MITVFDVDGLGFAGLRKHRGAHRRAGPARRGIALASVSRDRVGSVLAPVQVGAATANESCLPPFKTLYLKLITCPIRMAHQPTPARGGIRQRTAPRRPSGG